MESAACTSSELHIGSNYDPTATAQRPSHGCEKKQTQRIQDLEEQIRAIRASSIAQAFETSTDRIFADLKRNKDQAPSATRYSLDISTWAREIMGELPAAYRTLRKILPLPSERCLQEKFMNFQLCIRQALTDIDNIDLLIEIW
jgi:hypothetical protein